jgi:hypothetical protein
MHRIASISLQHIRIIGDTDPDFPALLKIPHLYLEEFHNNMIAYSWMQSEGTTEALKSPTLERKVRSLTLEYCYGSVGDVGEFAEALFMDNPAITLLTKPVGNDFVTHGLRIEEMPPLQSSGGPASLNTKQVK